MLLFFMIIVLTPEYADWFVYGVSSYLNSIYCWLKKLSSLKFLQSWNSLGRNNNNDSYPGRNYNYDDETLLSHRPVSVGGRDNQFRENFTTLK